MDIFIDEVLYRKMEVGMDLIDVLKIRYSVVIQKYLGDLPVQ